MQDQLKGSIGVDPPSCSISFLNRCRIPWLRKRAVPVWAHRVVQVVREASAAEERILSAHPDRAPVARKVREAPAFPSLGMNRLAHPHAAPVVRRVRGVPAFPALERDLSVHPNPAQVVRRVREAAACPVGRTE